MNEEELIKISIKLRRLLYKEWANFFNENKMKENDIFLINSVVMSSLIAQLVYSMFKKGDREINAHRESYIDKICEFSKVHLNEGSQMIDDGFNFH